MRGSNKNWLVFYTKPRHEFKAELEIKSLDVEVFLPTLKVVRQWSDRKKKITEPLFKSYIFAKCNERDRVEIIKLKSIVTNVHFGEKYSIVPEWEIEGIRAILDSNLDIKVIDGIQKGIHVKIIDGPLSGIIGIVNNLRKGGKEVAISLEMINRTVIATVPIANVEILRAG